jgi:DNA-binding MarR family transcriptional regulator
MSPDDEHYIGYMIADVGRLLRTVFDRRVRRLGLTRAQWTVLTRLHSRPGLSQSEVADLLEIEKATAGRLIDRLERKGWVERRADARDRRVNRMHLTARGERLHTAIWPVAESTVDEALSGLSPRERQQFTEVMLRVKGRLQSLVEHDPALTTRRASKKDEARVF